MFIGDDGSNADEDDTNDSDEQGTLTITVENESGEPVEDMIIAGIGPNELWHEGRTDENGQGTFELPDGDYYCSG